MLTCPHCAATLTRADLFSQRMLRPRTCAACGGEYFEGGTTVGFAMVGAGGALATRIGTVMSLPTWAPAVIAFGSAVLGVFYITTQPPRPIHELKSKFTQGIVAALVAAVTVFTIVNAVT